MRKRRIITAAVALLLFVVGYVAWFDQNSEREIKQVATKLPNDWGFHDTHGSVWEFCDDAWTPDHSPGRTGAPSDYRVRFQHKITRGGNFLDPAAYARCAYRDVTMPFDSRGLAWGFRPAFSNPGD